jgi:hypothetical protein
VDVLQGGFIAGVGAGLCALKDVLCRKGQFFLLVETDCVPYNLCEFFGPGITCADALSLQAVGGVPEELVLNAKVVGGGQGCCKAQHCANQE